MQRSFRSRGTWRRSRVGGDRFSAWPSMTLPQPPGLPKVAPLPTKKKRKRKPVSR